MPSNAGADNELLHVIEADGFHPHSERHIEVKGTSRGTLIISVTTRWSGNSDTSLIALLPEELEEINLTVNGEP